MVQTAEREIRDLTARLDELMMGFTENPELTEEVNAEIAKRTEASCRQRLRVQFEELSVREEELSDARTIARNKFNM